MANIYFKSVSLTNFMSYENAELNLARHGNILVGGINNNPADSAKSNGCGKSTLFNAVLWCLTGETISGAKAVENIYVKGKTSVTVEFEIDSNKYKITRTKGPSNLFFEVNGENKSGKGIKDTSKIIAEYLPILTPNLLNSVIILGQGLPQKFTGNTPAGRKEVLEKLSNSDFMINDLKEKVTARVSKLNQDKRNLEDDNLKIHTQIDSYRHEVKKLEEELLFMPDKKALEESIDEFTAKIELTDKLYQEAVKERNLYTEAYNANIEAQSSLQLKKEQALENLVYNDIKIYDDEIMTLSNQEAVLINKIREAESIRDVCPTCGRKFDGVVKIDTTPMKAQKNDLHEKIVELEEKKHEVILENNALTEETKAQYNDELKLIADTLTLNYNKRKEAVDLVNNYSAEIDKYKVKKYELGLKLQDYNSKVSVIEKRKTELNELIENSEDKLYKNNESLEVVTERLDINNKMQTLLKRDFRGYLLNNIISFIEDRAKVYSTEVFGTDKLKFELNGNNIDISYDDKDYSCLSGGEKQKLDVIVQFAIREMLCKFLDFSSNILVLDEITDALDSIGVEKIFNLIGSHLQDVEAIYIISHHVDELEIPADDEIKIIKGDDKISRIV